LPQVAPPSVDLLTKIVGTLVVVNSSGIDDTSQVLCRASKATLASLTRSYRAPVAPPMPDVAVMPGRNVGVPQVLPPSVDLETPMSVPPPSKKRPTWKAETIVEPLAKVSGSTSVACWLVVFVNGSWLIALSGTFADAIPGNARKTPATSSAVRLSARASM
jgi:hypothetical protein